MIAVSAVSILWASTAVLFVLLILKISSHSHYGKRKGLPPGNLGWPFFGETIEFLASRPTFTKQPFFETRLLRYGDIFKSHLFGQPVIISTNVELNGFILQNEGKLFRSCYPVKAYKDIWGRQSIAELHGDLQQKLHDVVAGAFSSAVLRGELLNTLQAHILRRLPSWKDQIVHVQQEVAIIILGVMLERLIDYDPTEEEMQEFQQYLESMKSLLTFPYSFPGSGYRRYMQDRSNLFKFIERKVAERQRCEDVVCKDILNELLKGEGHGKLSLSKRVIVENIISFLYHGQENIAMAITLAFKLLSESPKALQHLKGENSALQKKRGNVQLSWEDYESLSFTKNVVDESLRFASIVPWIFREALQDVDAKGYTIPKGCKVVALISNAHYDASNFTQPQTFDPWRWERKSRNDPSFMPFGGGLRACPAAEFSRVVTALFLHHLVSKYSWTVVENDEIIRFPVLNLQEGFPIAVKSTEDEDECLILH